MATNQFAFGSWMPFLVLDGVGHVAGVGAWVVEFVEPGISINLNVVATGDLAAELILDFEITLP